MSPAEKTYSDTTDGLIVNMTPTNLFDQWNLFETAVFSNLLTDTSIRRNVLFNAGAGRRITETETPFFDSFTHLYLLEPDVERRIALSENTKQRNAVLLSDRIEDIKRASIKADFVQCKYVLQHMHTDLLPKAVARLKSVVAKNGVIGIFSAIAAGDSYFQLRVPDDSLHLVPDELKKDANGRITEAQFNKLLSSPPIFPFIATHYISSKTLLGYFDGWDAHIEPGPPNLSFPEDPSNLSFLRARRPELNKIKRLLSRMKAAIKSRL